MAAEKILDVRVIAPKDKHPTIFQTFDSLKVGESFLLVNDHEPRPLFYQFNAERPEQFTWEYIEAGPDTWRVKIAKQKDASQDEDEEGGCCGCCGG